MRIFNVCTRADYEKDGKTKHKFYKSGEVHVDEATGLMFMHLRQNPSIRYYFFDTEEKLPEIDADTNTELPQ